MISMKKLIFMAFVLLFAGLNAAAQTEEDKIKEPLLKYIDATTNGKPQLLKEAFHADWNMYGITPEGTLRVTPGTTYYGYIQEGRKSNRECKIISIEYTENIAQAKLEVLIPGGVLFTDYFTLAKIDGTWKILHKFVHRKNLTE